MKLSLDPIPPSHIRMDQMPEGTLARVVDRGFGNLGHIIYRATKYAAVDLTAPGSWSSSEPGGFQSSLLVELLPAGAKVTLEQE